MLNITVAGTTLSTYYLADPGLFLREQREHADTDGASEGIRAARRELRRLIADIDETTTLGVARRQMASWLAYLGWRFQTLPKTLDEPLIAYDDPADEGVGQPRAWVLITPTGQHLDTSPSGRRAGKLRPQRQAETVVRTGQLPAVLLSNGGELRVIRRDPGLGGEASYLAVDLAGLAELGDDHEWRVLWALLRPEAFTSDAAGKSLWDRVEQASTEAADTVSENLSDGVRTAIRAVADGALADLRHRGAAMPTPRALFADALKIAYRLLFVAYSEDRGLLPVGTPAYDSGYSLRTLRDHVTDPNTVWAPDGGYLWSALRARWGVLHDGINAGELQISGFNGGLFDPDKCPLLDHPELTVGDLFVRELISALSWTRPTTGRNNQQVGRRRINYRDSVWNNWAASTRACSPSNHRSPTPPRPSSKSAPASRPASKSFQPTTFRPKRWSSRSTPPDRSTSSKPPDNAKDPAPTTPHASSHTSSSAKHCAPSSKTRSRSRFSACGSATPPWDPGRSSCRPCTSSPKHTAKP
jgi:hypothetical protein